MELIGGFAVALVVGLLLYWVQRYNEGLDADLAATLQESANAGPYKIELSNFGGGRIGAIRCLILAGDKSLTTVEVPALAPDQELWGRELEEVDADIRAALEDGQPVSVVTWGCGRKGLTGKRRWFLRRWDMYTDGGMRPSMTPTKSAVLHLTEAPENRRVLEEMDIDDRVSQEMTVEPTPEGLTGARPHALAMPEVKANQAPEDDAARISQALPPDGRRMNISPLRRRLGMSEGQWGRATEILVARNEVAVEGGARSQARRDQAN